MGELVVWALGTGFVTGAVWFGIHFYRRGKPDIEELRRLAQLEVGRQGRGRADDSPKRLIDREPLAGEAVPAPREQVKIEREPPR